LKLAAEDNSGNHLAYTLTPAFVVNGTSAPVLFEPAAGAVLESHESELSWFPVEEARHYDVQVATDTAFTQIVREWTEVEDHVMSGVGLPAGKRYFWRVRALTMAGATSWSLPFWFVVDASGDPSDAGAPAPASFSVGAPFPNPTRQRVAVEFELPKAEEVRLRLYDALGKVVMTVTNEKRTAGRYREDVDVSRLAAGVYFMHFQAGDFSGVRRLVRVN
jgi:hypothetical protein